MLVIMQPGFAETELDGVRRRIESLGYESLVVPGARSTAVCVTGNDRPLDPGLFDLLPGVDRAIRVSHPYKLASREVRDTDSVVPIADGRVRVGGDTFVVIAGPCSVESEDQIVRIARQVAAAGAHMLRGGAFKPRTSPYAFQGLGEDGLRLLCLAREETGLPIVTEALDAASLEHVAEAADVIQIGARNMQNYALLREAGTADKPVLLKRGMSATIEEWLQAAEYILAAGNPHVILCERGIRTFCTHSRNTLDLNAVPAVRHLSHLPILVDPSHGTGVRRKVAPLARAAAAIPAHGVMVEVHDRPADALSDGPQALLPDELGELIEQVRVVATAVDVSVPAITGAALPVSMPTA